MTDTLATEAKTFPIRPLEAELASIDRRAEIGVLLARAYCAAGYGKRGCVCGGDWSRCHAPQLYHNEAAAGVLSLTKGDYLK